MMKINNQIYLLMQDIVKMIERNIQMPGTLSSYNKCDLLMVKIKRKNLIFEPKEEQLKKSLIELQFLFSEWLPRNNKESEFIRFIEQIQFSNESIMFKISVFIFEKLEKVEFSLSAYVDNYAE